MTDMQFAASLAHESEPYCSGRKWKREHPHRVEPIQDIVRLFRIVMPDNA
jgi:hypothetical protein